MDVIEALWAELLSEEPRRTVAAFRTLNTEEREAVHQHLHKMATEAGWQPVQRDAAIAALAALHAAGLIQTI